MKYVILLSLLTSCGYYINRTTSQITGKPISICHNGISYLQFVSGATVEYEKAWAGELEPYAEPRIKKCKELDK